MTKRWLGIMAAAAGMLFTGSNADASPLTWTLQNVTFTDGGTASGSFVYDATTNTYSGINISVSAHGIFQASVFQFPDFNFGGALQSATALGAFDSNAANLNGANVFALGFTSPLTNAGGTDPLILTFGYSGEARCTNADCSNNNTYVNVNAGSVVARTTVPEPATFGLLGGALVVGLVAQKRFRRSTL